MKGLFIPCPACKRMLLKNANIKRGTYFDVRCSCNEVITLDSRAGKIELGYKRQAIIEAIDDIDDDSDVVVF